ncbi:MAG: inorganic diphosphatase, partial [Bdellovibrionales bacterium]|nr:inorganic diphosphatase [Bdellovibrionales bacterium]
LKMTHDTGQDEKVLCVPVNDPLWNHLHSLDDVPPHLLKEIEHFFQIYKNLEHKHVAIEGWFDREDAEKCIVESQQRCINTVPS